MSINKTFALTLSLALVLSFSVAREVRGETTPTNNSAQIQALLEQVKMLQKQINELQEQQKKLQMEVSQNLQLARQLSMGMSGDDVKALQELLASDPEVYPEGLITGFFGPLTEKAVKKFQEKNKIDTVGRVGPQTLGRINQLLTQGAGNSGKIPPGLLKAPGIAKKFPEGLPTPKPTPIPEPEKDTTPPVVSNITASSTESSLGVSWDTNEPARTKIWLSTNTPVVSNHFASSSSETLSTSHYFGFSSLSASSTYHFFFSSKDNSGNTTTSSEMSVETK